MRGRFLQLAASSGGGHRRAGAAHEQSLRIGQPAGDWPSTARLHEFAGSLDLGAHRSLREVRRCQLGHARMAKRAGRSPSALTAPARAVTHLPVARDLLAYSVPFRILDDGMVNPKFEGDCNDD